MDTADTPEADDSRKYQIQELRSVLKKMGMEDERDVRTILMLVSFSVSGLIHLEYLRLAFGPPSSSADD